MRKAVMNPCGHRILVLPKVVEETSAGGIIVHTDETSMKMEKAGNDIGTLFKVGPNAWKAYDDGEPWAKEGDTVVYAKWGGVFVTDPDTDIEYVLLNDGDVALVIETEVDEEQTEKEIS